MERAKDWPPEAKRYLRDETISGWEESREWKPKDSILVGLRAMGELPESVLFVVEASNILRNLRWSHERWAETRKMVDHALSLAEAAWTEGQEATRWRQLDRMLREWENMAREAHEIIQRSECEWDPESRRLTLPSDGPGQPRGLYRELVETLIRALEADSNGASVRERIAWELSPLFAGELTDTSSDSRLSTTINNVLRQSEYDPDPLM